MRKRKFKKNKFRRKKDSHLPRRAKRPRSPD
jgi:hypothetical protein